MSSIFGISRGAVTLSAVGVSSFIPIISPVQKSPSPIGGGYLQPGIYVTLSSGAVLVYTIEITGDDILAVGYNPTNANVIPFSGPLTNASTAQSATIGAMAMGIRAHVTSWTSGSLLLQVIQASL